jgi:hypothetical protein
LLIKGIKMVKLSRTSFSNCPWANYKFDF